MGSGATVPGGQGVSVCLSVCVWTICTFFIVSTYQYVSCVFECFLVLLMSFVMSCAPRQHVADRQAADALIGPQCGRNTRLPSHFPTHLCSSHLHSRPSPLPEDRNKLASFLPSCETVSQVAGALNLSDSALSMGMDLDFLVFFSSASAVLGLAGEPGYAAANGCLDGLAW